MPFGLVNLPDDEGEGFYELDTSADGYYLNRVGAGRLAPLGDLPMDGTYEILSSGCDDETTWFRYTPKHHLAVAATDSSAYVIARLIDGLVPPTA
jgi:hypothetical protein